MKAIGIDINSLEAVLVVLEKRPDGQLIQTNDCIKFGINDSESNEQVRQFLQQLNASLDTINADIVAILARNGKAKGRMAPSPFSFKLEGLFQLYNRIEVELVWPQTLSAYFKKNPRTSTPNKKFQEDAFNLAYYLLNRQR
jgi:hypothetical protein